MSRSSLDTMPDTVPPWSRSGEGDRRQAGLRRRLADGIAAPGHSGEEVRRELGLGEDAEDGDVARALVHAIAASEAPEVRLSTQSRADPRPVHLPVAVPPADHSFLGRLGARRSASSTSPGEQRAVRPHSASEHPAEEQHTVEQLEDVRTLTAVLRGGTLWQRRAAMLRLAERVAQGKGLSGAQQRIAIEAIEHCRDVEVAYERQVARERVAGRKARAEGDKWRSLVQRVGRELRAFWDGEREAEPLHLLPGEERAQLLLRVRDLPGMELAHLASVIEGTDGVTDPAGRRTLLLSVRYCGDPRLVPSLRAVLEADDGDLSSEAARALGRIADPRVHAALHAAYERSVIDAERAVIAGALGSAGDVRGASYVRSLLESDDRVARRCAVEALETLGTVEDGEEVARLLEQQDDLPLLSQAVRTLARIGDARALPPLGELRQRTQVSALRAEIEDAEAAVRARMELRGEDAGEEYAIARADEASRKKELARRQDPALVRLKSWKDYLIGQMYLAVGMIRRAVGRFEGAAARRSGWAQPLVAIGLAWARAGKHAQALAAFRRAMEADREWVEGHPVAAGALARSFLRRAEQMERDGRTDIAQGLLAEVLAADLRRAPSAVRFEIERRHEGLLHGERHGQ
jgi:tetratricopeptide (TPR) repeat protein